MELWIQLGWKQSSTCVSFTYQRAGALLFSSTSDSKRAASGTEKWPFRIAGRPTKNAAGGI
jgi:hypothetical protein